MDYFFKKYQNKWYIREVAYEWVERDEVMSDPGDSKNGVFQLEDSAQATRTIVNFDTAHVTN